jgi:hypothetical protein
MKLSTIIGGLALVSGSTLFSIASHAACPPGMSAEDTKYCVTVEGAGYDYQTYMQELADEQMQATLEKQVAREPAVQSPAEVVALKDC